MAVKLFDLGLLLSVKGLGAFTAAMTSAREHIESVNEAAKAGAPLREYSENLAMLGAGALTAGAALAAGLAYVVKPAIAMQAEMKRVQEAINDGADTMKHVNDAQARAEELSARGVIGATDLAEAYYAARSNAMNHTDALKAMNAANNLTIATTKNVADAQAQFIPTMRTLTTL
jgi:hypothetical protein